jgi:hypothetical protein
MPTECSADLFGFARVEGRAVVAAFDGGKITSDAGGLLLGAADRAVGLIDRFARCFRDSRSAEQIEHRVATMVGQRIFGIALGYEDVVDHDELRHDPIMAVLAGKLIARRKNCAPVAGKSTLNRLELGREEPTAYHKIGHDPQAIEALFVDLFLEAHRRAPRQIILDLAATDDPLHGHQEGASFTAITTVTAICRSMSSVAGICWPPNCAGRISMPAPGRWRKWRGSSAKSALAGRRCGSCCAPIRALPARG